LYKTSQAIRITRENLEILSSLKTLSRRNYETGKSEMADLLRINVNIREQENNLDDLQEQLATQKTEFNLLLNREGGDSLTTPGNIQLDTFNTVAYRDSIRKNPKLTALSHKETALKHQYQVDKKKGYPNISLGLDYAVLGNRQDMQVLPFWILNTDLVCIRVFVFDISNDVFYGETAVFQALFKVYNFRVCHLHTQQSPCHA